MDGTLRIGILGAGAIGRAVACHILGAHGSLELVGILGRTQVGLQGPWVGDLDALLAAAPHVVVEAASHDAVHAFGEPILRSGATLLCVSVGALADPTARARLESAARAGGSRIVVPSGAVGGLDLLTSARVAGLDEVVIEQRKPARVLLTEAEAAALTGPLVVFEGSVAEVVTRHPQTTNVAAAVALAGIGFERTIARVVADPTLTANRSTLSARGAAGAFTIAIESVPSPNPRTSAIVAPAVIATLERLRATLVVPG